MNIGKYDVDLWMPCCKVSFRPTMLRRKCRKKMAGVRKLGVRTAAMFVPCRGASV
jgi:hypothetical protein